MFPFATRLTPPPPLPRKVRPFAGETTASYLYRLAKANQLRPAALEAHLSGTRQLPEPRRRPAVTLSALAAAAGMPPLSLARALPELAPGPAPSGPAFQVRRVCWRCAARRDAWPFASVWQPAEDSTCRSHLTWTRHDARGRPGPQYSIGHMPEILQAQRRHRRLARHRGRSVTGLAFAEAAHITALWARHDFYRDRRRLVGELTGRRPATGRLEFADPAIPVVTYPESVDLAHVLAMPRWRNLPGDTEDDLPQFCRDIGQRLAIRYEPTSLHDPLFRWFLIHHQARSIR
jgi:TniQ